MARRWRWRWARWALVAVLSLACAASAAISACNDDDGGIPVDSASLVIDLSAAIIEDLTPVPQIFTVPLTGAEEVPPTASNATGTATVTVNPARTSITVNLNHSVVNTTRAQLQLGAVGDDGPVLFTLAVGTVASPLNVMLTSDQLMPQPAFGVNTFDDAVTQLLAGQTFLNIQSTTFPNGEIRGQIAGTPRNTAD